MKIGQLKTYIAIVESGSFSGGARKQGMSQPAATFQIQALEDSLGVKLIDRSSKALLLTEAGRLCYESGRKIISEVDALEQRLKGLSDEVRGDFRIGASSIPGEYILPLVLGSFKGNFPEAHPFLEVTDTEVVIEGVMEGEYDLGVVGAKVESKKLVFHPFVKDELIVIAHPGFTLETRKSSRLADLVSEPFVIRESGSGTRLVFERELKNLGLSIKDVNVALELGSAEGIITAVEAGLGLSVVSRWAASHALALKRVKELPVHEFPVFRDLYTVIPGNRIMSNASERFLQFLEDYRTTWRR